MARSLNKVQLIGNLTKDPELKETGSGTFLCTFTVATNRNWKTEAGEEKEATEFHRIASWQKLAELCSQLLSKGSRVFVEGRMETRKFKSEDDQERESVEVVINEMIVLSSRTNTESMNPEEKTD